MSPISVSQAATPKIGTACKKVGQISGTVVCTKKGTKLTWQKKVAPKVGPKPVPIQPPVKFDENAPATTSHAMVTASGSIFCYTDPFTQSAIDAYSIIGTHWSVTETLSDGTSNVLDEFDDLFITGESLPYTELVTNGKKLTIYNQEQTVYSYVPRNQKKGATYTCNISMLTKNGVGPDTPSWVLAVNSSKDFIGIGDDGNPLPIVTPTPTPTPTPKATPVIPVLDCANSGATSGSVPAWSSVGASKITFYDTLDGKQGAVWCPALAPSGHGPIIYTLTSEQGDFTCTTITTTCEGLSPNTTYSIMSTNEVGSGQSGIPYVHKGYVPCKPGDRCNLGPTTKSFLNYGNAPPTGLGTCLFASIANWQDIVLGKTPNETEIGIEFSEAGGSATLGITADEGFNYWRNHGIAGIKLLKVNNYFTDQFDVQNGVDSYTAMIAALDLKAGYSIGFITVSENSKHAVVVVGYTPLGPLIVTWGSTIQMTWQQWNVEVTNLWGFETTKS